MVYPPNITDNIYEQRYIKKELDKLGVNPNEYSLNGNIESDKIVLYQNYSKWEVFILMNVEDGIAKKFL